jgi:hypothetical protein
MESFVNILLILYYTGIITDLYGHWQIFKRHSIFLLVFLLFLSALIFYLAINGPVFYRSAAAIEHG